MIPALSPEYQSYLNSIQNYQSKDPLIIRIKESLRYIIRVASIVCNRYGNKQAFEDAISVGIETVVKNPEADQALLYHLIKHGIRKGTIDFANIPANKHAIASTYGAFARLKYIVEHLSISEEEKNLILYEYNSEISQPISNDKREEIAYYKKRIKGKSTHQQYTNRIMRFKGEVCGYNDIKSKSYSVGDNADQTESYADEFIRPADIMLEYLYTICINTAGKLEGTTLFLTWVGTPYQSIPKILFEEGITPRLYTKWALIKRMRRNHYEVEKRVKNAIQSDWKALFIFPNITEIISDFTLELEEEGNK